ncbi:MAG: class I SAM-dependent methyltransferase [Chthoniobacterales bacterium]
MKASSQEHQPPPGTVVSRLLGRIRLGSPPNIGRITANPNPLPADLDAPASLTWDCDAKKAELHLSRDGEPERRVSSRTNGLFNVNRIQAGIDFTFRLYNVTKRRRLLAELKVHREVAGRIYANPNPVPFEALGKTSLSWDVSERVGAEICVSQDGAVEQLVSRANKGPLEVDWLQPGRSYSFRLYSQRSPRRLLDEVTVSLIETPSTELLERLMLASGGLVKFIADVLPKYIQHENFPRWFRLWEKHGFHVTPVHFYEAIPDVQSLSDRLWEGVKELPGIEMNDATQLSLVRDVFPQYKGEYEQIPTHKAQGSNAFYLANTRFEGLDSLFAYCMVRHLEPRQIIEVGAGYSTLLLAQAGRKNQNTTLHCIEPFPEDFLKEGVPGLASLRIQKVEDVDLSVFLDLEAGDFLFIDTSHVVKIGGDVNFLFLEVIPRLNPGVIVHMHDIFLPFEYPKDWVIDEHRFWSEQYLLQAFLTYNSEFEVLVSAGYVHAYYREVLRVNFPRLEPWAGGSFWMRRKPGAGKGSFSETVANLTGFRSGQKDGRGLTALQG